MTCFHKPCKLYALPRILIRCRRPTSLRLLLRLYHRPCTPDTCHHRSRRSHKLTGRLDRLAEQGLALRLYVRLPRNSTRRYRQADRPDRHIRLHRLSRAIRLPAGLGYRTGHGRYIRLSRLRGRLGHQAKPCRFSRPTGLRGRRGHCIKVYPLHLDIRPGKAHSLSRRTLALRPISLPLLVRGTLSLGLLPPGILSLRLLFLRILFLMLLSLGLLRLDFRVFHLDSWLHRLYREGRKEVCFLNREEKPPEIGWLPTRNSIIALCCLELG